MPIKQPTFLFWMAALVSLGGILYGYDVGVISGALLFIRQSIPMTNIEIGVIVGAVLGGGMFGTLLAGPIGDYYGRRLLIILSSVIFIIGVNLILLSHSFAVLLLARVMLGIGIGLVAVGVPLYVTEMVPAASRGKYVTFFQLLLTFGIMLAYVVDLLFTSTGNWRAMFAVLLIPSILLFVGMGFLPETPRWLIAHNDLPRAREILAQIRGGEGAVEADMKAIQESIESTSASWQELFSPQFYLPTVIAILVAIFNQLTGINAFLQYAPMILKNAGLPSNLITMLGAMGIGILNFSATLLALVLVDKVGRRPLLLLGISGVIVAEVFLGLIQSITHDAIMSGVLTLTGLLCFIVCFAIGPGVVVWLAISELFPTKVRAKGMALCLFFNSLAATLLATLFLHIEAYFGMSHTYWLFAGFSLAYFLLGYFLLPETKERTLEDIQSHFQRRPSVLVNDVHQ